MKKILSIGLILFVIFLIPFTVNAEEKKITIYMARGGGCPHCEEAMTYFKKLIRKDEFKDIVEVRHYEIWSNVDDSEATTKQDAENYEVAKKVYQAMGGTDEYKGSVPYIVVGNKTFTGFSSSTEKSIEDAVLEAYNDSSYVDKIKDIVGDTGEILTVSKSDWVPAVIILVVVVGILGLTIYFARKGSNEEEIEKTSKDEKKEEPVKVEEKKEEKSNPSKTNPSQTGKKKTTKKKSTNKKTKKA